MSMLKLLTTFILFAILVNAAELPGIQGDWLGTLSFNGTKLRLAFHFKQSAGAITGTMDSLDQGAHGIPIDRVTFKDGKLSLQIAALHASYEGKLNGAAQSLSGT